MRGEKSPCPMSQICCHQSPAEQPEYENQNLNIEAIKIHLWITRFLQQSTLPSSYHWKYIGTIYIIINVILIKKIRNSNPAWVSHELTQKKNIATNLPHIGSAGGCCLRQGSPAQLSPPIQNMKSVVLEWNIMDILHICLSYTAGRTWRDGSAHTE